MAEDTVDNEGNEQEGEFGSSELRTQNLTASEAREEEAQASTFRHEQRIKWWLASLAIVFLIGTVIVVAVAFATFIVHVFIPDINWLEPEEQKRLVDWYSDAISPSSLPILVLNAWGVALVTLWLSRRKNS